MNHSEATAAALPTPPESPDSDPGINPGLTKPGKRIKETNEYLGMVRRMIRAAGLRVARDADPAALADLAATLEVGDQAMRAAINGLRAHGYSWAQIGAALGTSPQAAHKRWAAEPSTALEAFHDALSELHLRAGRPGTRVIATRAGSVSHSTVGRAMRERKILPTWKVTEKIVTQLGGDVEQFRILWREASR